MFYQWDFAFLLRYTPLFWKGVLVTLAYTAATILLGLIIGLLIGLGRLSRSKLLNIPLIAFIEAFRCTPLLVQIVWFYYALPVLLNIQIPATLTRSYPVTVALHDLFEQQVTAGRAALASVQRAARHDGGSP